MKTLLLALIVVVATAAPLLLIWALWQGLLGEWERYTAGQRNRFVVTVAITAVLVIGGVGLLILVDQLQ